MVQPKDVKIPYWEKQCCGKVYDTWNPKTAYLFRAFFHRNVQEDIAAKLCLTIWFICPNNNCFHAITYYYDKAGNLVKQIEYNKVKYLGEIQGGFLESAKIKQKPQKMYDMSKKYLWKYGKSQNGKIQNIYTFNDIKVLQEKNEVKRIFS